MKAEALKICADNEGFCTVCVTLREADWPAFSLECAQTSWQEILRLAGEKS
jgi:hypothetical protein